MTINNVTKIIWDGVRDGFFDVADDFLEVWNAVISSNLHEGLIDARISVYQEIIDRKEPVL